MASTGNVFLLGASGAGKSTVGPEVARALGLAFVDLDEAVAAARGLTVAEIFAVDGEEAFREFEARALVRECAAPRARVVALGGGAWLRAESRALALGAGACVYLRARLGTLARRLRAEEGAGTGVARPLLAGQDLEARLGQLLEDRAGVYELAPIVVDTDGLDAGEVASQVAKRVLEHYDGLRKEHRP